MSERKPTPEQQAAIQAEGEVLVSASAGSGKTFVMIEKIIRLILDGKAEVGSILAVTFTNLAAAEMKERLRAALVARINEEGDGAVRARLKAQLAEISSADICTIHSFCVNVIRRYFYESDVDGNFRVADEAESDKIRLRAVDMTFEKLLEEKSESFARLSRIFAGSRGFGRLSEILLKAYGKITVKADYAEFLRRIPQMYCPENFEKLAEEAFGPVRGSAVRLRDKCRNLREDAERFAEAGIMSEKYLDFLREREAFAEELAAASDIFAAAKVPEGREWMKKPGNAKLKAAGAEEALGLDERIGSLRGDIEDLKKSLSQFEERETEFERFLNSGETAAALAELLSVFDETYASLKRRAGVLDFSDLEHTCLALLQKQTVREQVRGKYTHVFVDEYQDVNPAQERILSLVAGENVFMVGDVKQSIYGFRGCSASFFAEKYERLAAEGRALVLNGNFRSSSAVLDAVNELFSGVMTKETCSVDYRTTSVMRAGSAAQQGGKVSIEFVPEEAEKDKKERDVYSVCEHIGPKEDEEYAEGALIAAIIADEVSSKRLDPASGKQVSTRFGDIAILTRGKKGRTQRIIHELVRRGVPVAADAEVNICDYPEVRTLISILQFLDNGAQDIPLAAALKSAMGGVTDKELADIRAYAGAQNSFYAACEQYSAANSDGLSRKLQAFYGRAERYRLLMNVKGAAEILTAVLSETGMEAQLLAMPCGAERVRRAERLIAECGNASVPEFLDKLKSGGYKVGFSEKGGENAVRVMTMHASKGLEFPVVIAAGLSARFNADDLSGVLFDGEWGFAAAAYDFERYVSYETVLRAVLKTRLRRKRAEDEMRLFYVAVTRAKSNLHLIFEKEQPFDAANVSAAGSCADFVDFEKFRDLYAPAFGKEIALPAERVLTAEGADEEAKRAVLRRYRVPYAHAESTKLPVKTSASALMKMRAEEEDFDRTEEEFYESAADAATGTAYHAFLERADFSAPPKQEAARICAAMREEGMGEAVDEKKGADILSMPLFASLSGHTLYRERKFLLSVPACEITDSASKDEILLQGVIDLMAIRGDECVIVDYKYSSHGEKRLLADYAQQLKIYACAAKRIPKVKKVTAYIVNILRGFAVKADVG